MDTYKIENTENPSIAILITAKRIFFHSLSKIKYLLISKLIFN